MNDENIYSAPQANLELDEQHETVLAGRWTRFWAALLDTIIILVVFVPTMFLLGLYDRIEGQQFESSDLLLSALVLLFYALLNGYLLATSGQTIAKKMFNIRVVDYDTDQLLPFWKIFGVRYLPLFVVSQLPGIGQFIGIVDSVFIFSKENRCLHDQLANTKVVKV
ncbi:RDD family protein [Amphritea pacifica]|uniref:RDD family protein n=1 Tax=Amphritea pacifica TaxID=2811233 RepID=A0ABS2WCS2_9GAMM|nr:RDD family protein [Amphritea pacifica]MBN0989504.1 RDD family protein [Amphritea pacifica]